jgi:hypothetical protein
MKRFSLATQATLVGVLLSAGCASPCGGCGPFQRMSLFRGRMPCPCECCSDCGGRDGGVPFASGGVPIAGGGPVVSDGPLLEPPPGPPLATLPPPGAAVPAPTPLPGGLGAPLPPAVPAGPDRLVPIPPGAAQPVPAESSSRRRRR